MREMKTEVALAATLRLSQPHADAVDGKLAQMWLSASQHEHVPLSRIWRREGL